MLLIGRGTLSRVPIGFVVMTHGALALLGQQIRRLREERDLSQEEFASLADIDRAYYGGIERGERNVAAINLIKIAQALSVEVGELFPSRSTLRRARKDSNAW